MVIHKSNFKTTKWSKTRATWSRTTKRSLLREWSRARETLPGTLNGKCLTRRMRRRFAAVIFVRCCPNFSSFPAIGHFWVTKTLTFKTRLSAKPFLCIWILFAWEYHWKSSYKKSFKFIMPMVFLLRVLANLLKHSSEDAEYACIPHKWIVLFARAARWLAKYYSWLSSDVTKIHRPKSQILLRFYHHLAKYLLKINFRASFQRDIVFHFENVNFASLLRVTLIYRATAKAVTYAKK